MKGLVFDIKRFATHDGNGIRTTVFLKGCTLKCIWCQNPEGISIVRRPLFFSSKCIKCGTCLKYVRDGGMVMRDGQIVLNSKKNENWDLIVEECPAAAMTMDSREYTVDEIVEELLKDKIFFKYDGGVTLSGGEPLYQNEFAAEILKRLKELGISTSIETAMNVPTEVLEEVLPYLDELFVDCKIMDTKTHRYYTGVGNERIKQNLAMLLTSEYRDRVVVRTPLIPGMTANLQNVAEISEFISGIYPQVKYELLNYNPLAGAKYGMVDMKYCFEDNPKRYTDEQMREFGRIATDNGIRNLILDI